MASLGPTLLGVCDGHVDGRYRTSYLTNKVGGRPDWAPRPPPEAPRCPRCAAPLAHVVQVYCPLEDSPFHRNIRLFACPASECGGRPECWRALRSQCPEVEAAAGAACSPAPPQEAPLPATHWCDAADDWGEEEEEDRGGRGGGGVEEDQQEEAETICEAGTDVSSRLQDLSLGESQDDVPVLASFFISVVEESDLCGEDGDLQHVQELLREYERREGVAVGELECGGGGGGEEKYEKTKARHGDAVFSRFMKKISLCPQQILRYCRGGKPLFISEPPPDVAQAAPACSSCGASRTFELQLMPALVSLLRRKDGGGGEAELEFGTVLVYTCTKSCWTAASGAAVDEFCFVQADPDQQLFK